MEKFGIGIAIAVTPVVALAGEEGDECPTPAFYTLRVIPYSALKYIHVTLLSMNCIKESSEQDHFYGYQGGIRSNMHNNPGHGHRFNDIERLRSAERLARLEVDRVVELALEGNGIQTVLDIGTGTGVFAEAFSQRRKLVTGIDVNPEMLAMASHYVPEGVFQPAAAEELPFADASFDLAFMGLVLHETDDLLKALQEAYRVTRLRLAVLEWPYAEQDFGPGLEERLQPNQVMQLAGQAGFITRETHRLEQLVLYHFDKGPANGEVR